MATRITGYFRLLDLELIGEYLAVCFEVSLGDGFFICVVEFVMGGGPRIFTDLFFGFVVMKNKCLVEVVNWQRGLLDILDYWI
ncbi:MAG: hypothetical protein KJ592_02515 [Nanoarchaeota archaeon]|nr:hypothetical protein [Nanoarchaeota archaeon]